MPRLLRRCENYHYTIDQSRTKCRICGTPLSQAAPARYSPLDRYAKYRRQMRELSQLKSGNDAHDQSK